ncbi:MAG: hypothetical protein H8E55_45590 [Pelagibacterales bacterium]|jgi:hypothetical protein|nr:hypothetical protein [Pelagibacterales bacterium]|tara:strand:+ start:61 stop:273 length:213 start_codon:yes stop_codon:yes gene_type:complete
MNKWKYRSVSLRNSTYSKINDLTSKLVPGVELSSAKVVDKLVEDSHSNFRRDANNGITNYDKTNKEYQKA